MPITQKQKDEAQIVQHAAAHDNNSRVRLVAGPGTGKSFVIEERVRWLLAKGVSPDNIYVVSFTRASSRELRQRVHEYCAKHGIAEAGEAGFVSVSISTLHSLALQILKKAGLLTAYPSEPAVMDKWEQEKIFDAEFSRFSGATPTRCKEIRREHEAFWSTDNWYPPNYIPPNPPVSDIERNQFTAFHDPRGQVYCCVLPGEIVRKCVQFIKSGVLDPVALLQSEHLIVDEFQDLNPCDLEFVKHLTSSGVTTFVAGDDDQSIYSFRFASPAGIQQFLGGSPDGQGDHQLHLCFRCTPAVLQVAKSLIVAHSLPDQLPKELTSVYTTADPPLSGLTRFWHFPSSTAEARAIAESCRDLIDAGIPPRQILILISDRTILQKTLIGAFDALDLPYERATPDDYINTKEGRFLLACLRVIGNAQDYVAHRTLLGIQPGIGIVTCTSIADKTISNGLNFVQLFYAPLPDDAFTTKEVKAISGVRGIVEKLSGWQDSDALSDRSTQLGELLGEILGETAVKAWTDNTSMLPQEMNLGELREYLWADADEQKTSILTGVYERLGLPVPETGLLPSCVRMMTMHGAKGLSGQVVFIPGLEESLLPSQHSKPYPGLILEAARLLYVSISRARVACILSYASKRKIYGNPTNQVPSRFTANLGGKFVYRSGGGLSKQDAEQIQQGCELL